MSDYKQVKRMGAYAVWLMVSNDGGAIVCIGSARQWWDPPHKSWICFVDRPPWYLRWVPFFRTIPEAIALAATAMERQIEQDVVRTQAEKDAEEMATEIAKMYRESP